MPDRWGRPTFNDGMQLAQGLMVAQNWQQNQQDRQTEKDAYSVAQAMQSGDDISGFSDEAKYKGAKLKYENDIQGLNKQLQEYRVSNEGRQQKLFELQEIDAKGKRLFAQYQAARRSGDEATARKIAHTFNNEVAYNGIYIPEVEAGTGKLSIVRQANGKAEEMDDMPIEQYDQMISGYMNIPREEMMKRMLTGEQWRMKRNLEIISNAEPMINDKGDIIYKVPAGTLDKKDSSIRGAFYIDSPVSGREIPAKEAKGYKPFNVAKGQKDLGKKEVVDPKKVVTGVGAGGTPQQGLIVQGNRGPEFQKVAGVPAQGLQTLGPVDPSKAKSAYELRVKQLNTELMPFNKTEAPIFEKDATGNYVLSEGGHNALNAAWKLVQRYQANPQSLSPQENQYLPNAAQAVKMYQSLSQQNAQSFGIGQTQQGGAQGSNIQRWIQVGKNNIPQG